MVKKIIRIPKKQSAFVYAILESLEGMTSFTTLQSLPVEQGMSKDDCDILLNISEDFLKDMEFVLEGFRKKFPLCFVDRA